MQNPEPITLLPPAERAYLAAVVQALRGQLGAQLIGVYLFGSAAAGAYEPGVSDLDIQAVVAEPLPEHARRAVAASLAHGALPCPARRLEFVIYARAAIQPARRHPRFELNWNTGAGEPDHISLDPAAESSHWFLLDIALGREIGRSLLGPEPRQVFGPIPRAWVLEAILDSLAWHHAHEAASANAVLNACRAWRYAVAGSMGSKMAGAAWAQHQPDPPTVVAQAEQRRRGGPPLDPAAVRELMERVTLAVRAALRAEREQIS